MASPILLPIIGFSVLSVLVSYVAIRLYRYSNGLWSWHKSLLQWSKPSGNKKKSTVDLLPITGLPPPPTALPSTPPPPPLVDITSSTPPVSFYQQISKQIHSLHPTSFPRPPSPHALLATTPPPKLRRSRSLGGVPVRRLSGGSSGLRNVQILDLDMEMQEMNKDTSREHLLIDFSSSGSSDDLDAWRKENEEGIPSRRISPASSDIGVLPSHRRPSLFDHSEDLTLDLAPGKKVVQLVDLADVEDGMGIRQKDNDSWTWAPLPRKIHFTPIDSAPSSIAKPISKSISEPLPLPMPEGKLIDFHSGSEEEHVLVDLDVQDGSNVPQQERPQFIQTNLAITNPTAPDVAKPLDETRSPLEGRRSLDSLMKPVTITTSDPISSEIKSPISSRVVEEPSQRGQRVDWHPLQQEAVKEVPEKVEANPTAITGAVMEIMKDDEELANEHENYELHDRYDDDYSYAHNIHHHQPLDTTQGEPLENSSSSHVATVPLQAAPAWYWDHEDDPWNAAVGVNEDVKEEDVKEEEHDMEEEPLGEREEVGEDGDGEVDASQIEAVGEDEDILKASLVLDLPVECSLETETEHEDSYPDPDYLPLPELLLDPTPMATQEVPLVLVEDDHFKEDEDMNENQTDQVETEKLQQQFKDDEDIPRRIAAQMPTPPASPPTSLRVKGLGLGGTRSGPPSPSSFVSSTGGLLPLGSLLPLSTSQPASPKLVPSLVPIPKTSEPSPATEVHAEVPQGDQENAAGVDKENEMPSSTTGRPLWSMRASDAPALGLAASSSSLSTSTGLAPGVGTNTGVSPRMKRRALGDVTGVVENAERERKEVEIKEKEETVKGAVLKEEKGEEVGDEESSLPGTFPELLNPASDIKPAILPTITIAALTSTLLSTSITATSSSSAPTTTTTVESSSTALETLSPVIQHRRPRQHIARSPLDIALAMQLRPGLGVGADPAWMVRFLMTMFGWFAILVSGQGEF